MAYFRILNYRRSCRELELLFLVSEGYDFPILKIREVGHRCPSTFLPIGGKVLMDADAMRLEITDPYLS